VSNKTEDIEDITFDWYIYWKGSGVCCSSTWTRKNQNTELTRIVMLNVAGWK